MNAYCTRILVEVSMIIVLDPPWIKDSFKWCVDVLIYWAKVFDISYEAINIYIFASFGHC